MNRRRALSLIEVVLAIVILGLAVPPLMIQLGSAVQAQTVAGIHLKLVELASGRMGTIFADCADATRGYAYITNNSYPDEVDPTGLQGYRRVTTVREVSPADYLSAQPGSGIKRFRIVVTGPEGSTLRAESFVTDLPAGGG